MENKLITFLYLLARDEIPFGAVMRLIKEAEDAAAPVTYENASTEAWARGAAARLLGEPVQADA